MSQKILHINARLVASPDEFERDNNAESAQEFKNIPGLLWKIAYINRDAMEAGGFYLFKDEAALQAFLEGPIVAQLPNYPLWTDMKTKKLDILVEFSKVVRAPIGEKYEPGNGVLTFNQLVEDGLAQVPTIKPADAHRRQKKEPELLVIDVRDAAEIVETGTIPGAVNISLGSLTYKADHEVPEEWREPLLADRSRPIITTCILGPLGAIGGGLLHEMGFTNVQILEGGVQAWIDAGLPTVG